MPTRDEFLRLLWDEVIDAPMSGEWIDNQITESQSHPNGAFADAGKALERLLGIGAERTDLCSVVRASIYEAVFSVLYMLDDPGVDDGDVFMLQESLLSADPTGREGRPPTE